MIDFEPFKKLIHAKRMGRISRAEFCKLWAEEQHRQDIMTDSARTLVRG